MAPPAMSSSQPPPRAPARSSALAPHDASAYAAAPPRPRARGQPGPAPASHTRSLLTWHERVVAACTLPTLSPHLNPPSLPRAPTTQVERGQLRHGPLPPPPPTLPPLPPSPLLPLPLPPNLTSLASLKPLATVLGRPSPARPA